ncbi:MAG: ATP-binding protein [Pirellulales bacterium]
MKFLKKSSINKKLTLLVMAAVAAALLLSYVSFVVNDVRIMRSSMVRQLNALAQVLGANSTAAIAFDDEKSAAQMLSSLSMQPMVESACIYDAEGSVFASYAAGGADQAFPPPAEQTGYEFRDGYLNVYQTIEQNDEVIGQIYLHASLEPIRDEIVNYAGITAAVMSLSFIAAYLLAKRLQRGISDPILALARTAERISKQQDYSIRVQKTSDDELGVMYDEFNHMLEQVETGKRELQEAHRKLQQQSQERMRAIVETAADAIITLTDQDIIETCNGAACELFDYSREELIGSNFALLWSPMNATSWHDFLHQKAQQVSKRREATEIYARRKDGHVLPLLASVSEVSIEHGCLRAVILRDLTEYKRLQQELGQAQRLESIGQLAAGIAHEINTPMQFLSDNIEYLSECCDRFFEVVDAYQRNLSDEAGNKSWLERRQELDEIIHRNRFDVVRDQIPRAIAESLDGVRRVIDIVRAMKEFSHQGREEKVGVDLNNAVRSTVMISRNRWKYVADLETDLDPDLPTLRCVPAEINQVLLNLVVNAADAVADVVGDRGDTKGQIKVCTRKYDHGLVVEVKDTGCGIPAEIRDRIFDPFFTTKDVGKGTGQGLAICYNIVVVKHHGTIEVDSEPGVGTTFRVTLPVGTDDSGDQASESFTERPLEAISSDSINDKP